MREQPGNNARLSAARGGVWRAARGTDGPGAWPPTLTTIQAPPTAAPRCAGARAAALCCPEHGSERAAGPTRRLAWQGTQGSHRAARWLAPAHMVLGARMPRATLNYARAKIWRVPGRRRSQRGGFGCWTGRSGRVRGRRAALGAWKIRVWCLLGGGHARRSLRA